jgi:hypothetical protein
MLKVKQGTDLTKYGFTQWPSGIWYLNCKPLEKTDEHSDMSLIVENDELRLYHTLENFSTDNTWLDSVFEMPSVLIEMIRDKVLEEKDE